MKPVKQCVIRAVDAVNSLGFSLIIGGVIYFIIGSVASLVKGTMLGWTFCGSARHLFGVEWCGIGSESVSPIGAFVHRLLNVPLPWFMLFWGFVLTGVCALLLKLLDHHYVPPGSKK